MLRSCLLRVSCLLPRTRTGRSSEGVVLFPCCSLDRRFSFATQALTTILLSYFHSVQFPPLRSRISPVQLLGIVPYDTVLARLVYRHTLRLCARLGIFYYCMRLTVQYLPLSYFVAT